MKLVAQTKRGKLVRAVRANPGVERWYRDRLQQLVRQMSCSVLCHVRAQWRRDTPEHGFAHDAVDPTVRMRWALNKWGKHWESKLAKLSDEVARRFTQQAFGTTQTAMQAAFRDAGFTVKFRPTRRSISAYKAVLAENVALIKSIPRQYMAAVEQAVWSSVRVGGDLSQLTQTIEQKYGVAHRRAAFIARDQNHKAKAVIERTRRAELGIKRARWRHSHAGKTPRPEHVEADGKFYEVAKGMFLEGVWTWPGERPNCRCTDEPVIPGLDEDE